MLQATATAGGGVNTVRDLSAPGNATDPRPATSKQTQHMEHVMKKQNASRVPLVTPTINQQVTAGIARAMRRKKLTQTELAERMHTSRGAVHRILEEGQITLSTLGRCAKALGVRVTIRIS